jgi:heat-inducible transcriptional repressor
MLNEREKVVFKTIVDIYMEKKEPVGSRYVSKISPLGLSPASIRNIMSDLEEIGLITHPHTSAGRIPTDKGYKYYIEEFININTVDSTLIEKLKLYMNPVNFDQFFSNICSAISELTNSVGFIFEPKISSMELKHIEFVKLSSDKVIGIVVTNTGIVHNILLNINEDIKDNELVRVSNYLNSHFKNKNFYEMKNEIERQLLKEKEYLNQLIDKVKKISDKMFTAIEMQNPFFISGAANLIDISYASDIENLKNLLKSIEEKSFIYEVLNKCLYEKEIKIFVGSDIGNDILKDYTLLTKAYNNKNIVGYLGVLGPKNMQYPSIIPLINYTAELISKLLNNYGGNNG